MNAVKKLQSLLEKEVKFINKTRGEELENAVNNMQSGDVILVQNTRYEDLNDKKERYINSRCRRLPL